MVRDDCQLAGDLAFRVGEIQCGELFVVYFCGAVVCLGCFDFVFEVAEWSCYSVCGYLDLGTVRPIASRAGVISGLDMNQVQSRAERCFSSDPLRTPNILQVNLMLYDS